MSNTSQRLPSLRYGQCGCWRCREPDLGYRSQDLLLAISDEVRERPKRSPIEADLLPFAPSEEYEQVSFLVAQVRPHRRLTRVLGLQVAYLYDEALTLFLVL